MASPCFVATGLSSPTNKTRPRATGATIPKFMRFKIDKYLEQVAAAKVAPVDTETVAVDLCKYMINAGIIEDTPEHWGESVLIATGPQYVKDICDLLAGYLGVDRIHTDVFDAFCRLTVVGDGDCPKCGGELKFIEKEGHELNDGDYFTPNSYVIDNYVYRCVECGEIIKTPNEL